MQRCASTPTAPVFLIHVSREHFPTSVRQSRNKQSVNTTFIIDTHFIPLPVPGRSGYNQIEAAALKAGEG